MKMDLISICFSKINMFLFDIIIWTIYTYEQLKNSLELKLVLK